MATDHLHHDLFLSHSHADAPLVEQLFVQLEAAGISCFLDVMDMPPGGISVEDLAEHLAASNAVAVLVGPSAIGRWHREEAVQALSEAIDSNKPAFIVWMPGSSPNDASEPGALNLPAWLTRRTTVDLRGAMVDGRLTDDGLAAMYAGARSISKREALQQLEATRRGLSGQVDSSVSTSIRLRSLRPAAPRDHRAHLAVGRLPQESRSCERWSSRRADTNRTTIAISRPPTPTARPFARCSTGSHGGQWMTRSCRPARCFATPPACSSPRTSSGTTYCSSTTRVTVTAATTVTWSSARRTPTPTTSTSPSR